MKTISLLKFLKRNKLLLIAIAMTWTSCTENNPPPSPPELKRLPLTSAVDNKERDYFLYLPEGYASEPDKEWPVLLFLHGDGERGNGKDDLDFVMIHGPLYEAWVQKRNLPFILIVPQLPLFGRDTIGLSYLVDRDKSSIPRRLETGCPPRPAESRPPEPMQGVVPSDTFPGGRTTLPNGWERCEADLLTMIGQVQKDYRTDSKRLYLSGLSYGGFGTWYMASKHPDLFAAINPVVGWGHPDLMAPIAEHQLPVWVFSGGRDEAVPGRYFHAGINKLEALGHQNLRFTIEEDMGHDVWKRVYAGEDIYNWLLSHSKE